MKPVRHTILDALLPLILVGAVFAALAIVVTGAYRAGYRDAEFELTRGKGRITAEEIEQRRR